MTSLASTDQLGLGLNLSLPALFPGDIIATRSSAFPSQAIGWATNAQYSHAILYVDRGRRAVDAMPDKGVTVASASSKLVLCTSAAVFRHRTASPKQLESACSWAMAQAGKSYDFLSAARAGLQPGTRTRPARFTPHGQLIVTLDAVDGLRSEDTSFMCSELIFRAFEIAGIPLSTIPASMSAPGLLRWSTSLAYMGDLDMATA